MKFSKFPFLRYVLFFVIGILIYRYVRDMEFALFVHSTGLLFLMYATLAFIDTFQRRFNFKVYFPFLAYSLLIVMGMVFSYLKDAKNDPLHLMHQGKIDGYVAIVEGLDERKAKTFANRIAVQAVKAGEEESIAHGEVIIYHQLEERLSPGELVYIKGSPNRIEGPKNPHEFDYRKFLANQQIFHSHFVADQIIRLGKVNHRPIHNFILNLRNYVQGKMDLYILNHQSNQIAKALLLGQNKNLEKEISEAYITAGTMHVLAVSGLHVGIVYGFFFFFIKPHRLGTRKRVLYLSFIILIIWLYALITGLAPSVQRAATMFTLMGMAQMKSRRSSIYNSLGLSAMLLMVFNPFIIYSVGFQLSYVAVFGIVLLQPKIRNLWKPRHKMMMYVRETMSVGIAAQLATFPISVYYFHVFPSYFMFANLIAIPGAFLIMSIGIPFMLLSFHDVMASWLGYLVNWLIYLENELMFLFQRLPMARIENIQLSPPEMGLIWLLIIAVYMMGQDRRKDHAYLFLLIFSLLTLSNWTKLWEDFNRNELYIYAVGDGVALDYFYRGQLYSHENDISAEDVSYKILPNRIKNRHRVNHSLTSLGDGSSKYFLLSGQAFLKIGGRQFEVDKSSIRRVSRYEEGIWKVEKEGAWSDVAYKIEFSEKVEFW